MGKRATSVLVAGIFVLGACSGGSKNAGSSVTSTKPDRATSVPNTATTVPRTTTTTTTPEYSFDDSVPPPKLINTGTDYVAILKSLDNYGNWLEAHRPDPTLAAETLAPGSELLKEFARDLRVLRTNDKRAIETVGNGPNEITILSATPSAFSATVVQDVRSVKSVDSSGRVTGQVDFATPRTYLALVVLVRNRWYVAAFDIRKPSHVHL
ncbi:MAG: hypothetical protein QOF59_1545 [Actinomycetota bacterium]|nr:hypothetical protein [Actinomycetota bacterium]